MNGTSVSTAIAALAIHDCNSLAIASQVLSAFGEPAHQPKIDNQVLIGHINRCRSHQGLS